MAGLTRKRTVRTRLTCGCVVLMPMAPLNPKLKLICDTGLGHGYQQGWVEWFNTETGRTGTNPNA